MTGIRGTSFVKHSLLLVDDNFDACALAAILLRSRGYKTDFALDGFTALELIEKQSYSLAIIDYDMPGMNGVELFRRMHKLRPEIQGVFVTGYTTIDVVYPAIEVGISRVLGKPMRIDELMPVIEELVGGPSQ